MALKELIGRGEKRTFYEPRLQKAIPEVHFIPEHLTDNELKTILRREILLIERNAPREIHFVQNPRMEAQLSRPGIEPVETVDIFLFDYSEYKAIIVRPKKEVKASFAMLFELAKRSKEIVIVEKERKRIKKGQGTPILKPSKTPDKFRGLIEIPLSQPNLS